MKKESTLTPAYRWSVASRVAAAALGGYALTSAATVLMSLLWPAPRAQGVLWATMISFTVYTVAVIWAVHTRSAARAWTGMVVGTLLLSGISWLLWLAERGGGA
ncbi:iron transporter [Thauera sp. SDU_THAU2]|uniref:iron transporter n=1 Tax=Thauera sp. SDU_THAU2 TaxID=3136633 RepID=UPI0031203CC4